MLPFQRGYNSTWSPRWCPYSLFLTPCQTHTPLQPRPTRSLPDLLIMNSARVLSCKALISILETCPWIWMPAKAVGSLFYISGDGTPLVHALHFVYVFICLISSQVSWEPELDHCYGTVYVSLEQCRVLKLPYPMNGPCFFVAFKMVLIWWRVESIHWFNLHGWFL